MHANHSASLESSVDFGETPFAEEARLPLFAFSRGRVQLGPFYSYRYTENVLMGPPGAGSLSAWSVSMQNHPGVIVPLGDETYGLSLAVRLKGESDPEPRIHLFRCLAWVVGGHGCISK